MRRPAWQMRWTCEAEPAALLRCCKGSSSGSVPAAACARPHCTSPCTLSKPHLHRSALLCICHVRTATLTTPAPLVPGR